MDQLDSLGMKWVLFALATVSLMANSTEQLLRDLDRVKEIDQEINDRLPFIYNNLMVGGYFAMPSARMNDTGMVGLGIASAPPYSFIGLNFQMFKLIELSGNLRVKNGILDGNFGAEGFGDETDRTANVKFGLLRPSENFNWMPNFAIGWNDFYGARVFHTFYAVATKTWVDYNFEATLGWGKDRIDGWFGGIGWSPLRKTDFPILKNLTLIAEYDANNYKSNDGEHPDGRTVHSRINVGAALTFMDIVQLKVASLRGQKLQGSVEVNYNLGATKGLFPKVDNPQTYLSPVDTEPVSDLRPGRTFSQELAFALCEQGFFLSDVYLICDEGEKRLWIKVVNVRYREEVVVRDRLQHVLAAIVPSNVTAVTVVLEADALASQQYDYRTEELYRYREGQIGRFELETFAPREEASRAPSSYEAALLFHSRKDIVTFTIRPRLITFFGSVKGKLKVSAGVVAGPEGYLFHDIYYKTQVALNAYTSMSDVGDMDRLNPSKLPNVRSDTVRYFQSTFSLEQAYLQKGFNLGQGWFWRLASGYFEPAYGGLATEFLYYPVNSNWAIGVEGAGVLKRNYTGLGFTTKVNEYDGFVRETIHFIGYQYFLDFYYNYKPLQLNLKVSAGKFLARDVGARIELTRYYKSGLQFSIWCTFTNANDRVNHHRYQDKGIAFLIPFDIFLKKSSRTFIPYAMSAWLRDVGAKAATGKPLFRTLYNERI